MQTPGARRSFAEEVRAVARMAHPHIVRVFDHGQLDRVVEVMSDGQLKADSPYLVMELGHGGSLAPSCGYLDWPACQRVLLDLLEALAHAHARGLIHRDLKPENVLVHHVDNLSPGIRLTDFGLARALVHTHRERIAGTPAYMAPEQLRGDWRAFGPWTDLYALGCLGWCLVAGAPPFVGDLERVQKAQLYDAPPPLVPVVRVPDGLEDWLRRLLAKSPEGRFGSAADASHALLALGDEDARSRTGPRPEGSTSASETFQFGTMWMDAAEVQAGPPAPAPPRARPPVPEHWQPRAQHQNPPQLLGVGEELFRLREVGVVGRQQERDRLWAAVREQKTRVVVVSGPAGTGKSRLAAWLRHRAVEVGVAQAIAVAASDVVAADLRPRLVEAVVLTLDEAERNVEALRFARGLLREPPDAPVVVVVTVRSSELDATGRAALDALLAQSGAESVALGPLARPDMALLVERLLGLESDVAARVVARAAGNPSFAVELVGDLIARGHLEPGPAGLRLRKGAELQLPAELQDVWSARIDDTLRQLSVGAGAVMELAAVLGREVSLDQVDRVCAQRGTPRPPGLVDRLVAVGLVEGTPTGFRFRQALLHQGLVRRAGEAGRLRDLHAACAAVVDEGAQRGHHLVGAGQLNEALPVLLASLSKPRAVDALVHAAVVTDVMNRLGVPAEDPRRGDVALFRCEALVELGNHNEAEGLASALVDVEGRPGWESVEPRARSLRGRARRAMARYEDSGADFLAAIEQFTALGLLGPAAHALHGLALVDRQQGRVALARERIEASRRGLIQHGAADRDVAAAGISFGSIALLQQDHEAAAEALEEALVRARRLDDGQLVGVALAALGEVLREGGDLEGAEQNYEAAYAVLRFQGLGMANIVRLNLAVVSGLRGRHERSRQMLLEVQARARMQGNDALVGIIAALVLPASAALGNPGEVAEQLDVAVHILEGRGLVEADVARACERAAEDSTGVLRTRLLRLAASQWGRMGRSTQQQRVLALI